MVDDQRLVAVIIGLISVVTVIIGLISVVTVIIGLISVVTVIIGLIGVVTVIIGLISVVTVIIGLTCRRDACCSGWLQRARRLVERSDRIVRSTGRRQHRGDQGNGNT
jgi:uncharacterized membrane protein